MNKPSRAVFALVRPKLDEPTINTLSVAQASCLVRQPRALLRAQADLDDLAEKQARRQGELRALVASVSDREKAAPAIRKITDELTRLDAAVRNATIERDAARKPYGQALEGALQPLRSQAIATAVAGLDRVLQGLAVLDEIGTELGHAGVSAPRFSAPYRAAISALRGRLKRLP
jgi:NAD(P)-dependent dehydrogenase (short-subunit alcohol dehydrogenase family)